MKWYLKELIGRYDSRNPGTPMTYRRIEEETGISKTAIHRIATNKASRADLATMNTLLGYMSNALGEPLTVNDLLHYEPDRN